EDRLRHRSHDGIHQLAILEKQDAGDGTHVEARRGLDVTVHVELAHLQLALVICCELLHDRSDHPTRPAPGGPEIHKSETVSTLDLVRKVVVSNGDRLAVLRHDVSPLNFPT